MNFLKYPLLFSVIFTILIFIITIFVFYFRKKILKKNNINIFKDSYNFLKHQAFIISYLGLISIVVSSENIYQVVSSFEEPVGRIYDIKTDFDSTNNQKIQIKLLYYNKNKNYYARLFTKTKDNPNLIFPTKIFIKKTVDNIYTYTTKLLDKKYFVQSKIIWAYYDKRYDNFIGKWIKTADEKNKRGEKAKWGIPETNLEYFILDSKDYYQK